VYHDKLKICSGGNLFGISAGAHAGYSENESDALASANEKKHRTMNITYNVGRALYSMSLNLHVGIVSESGTASGQQELRADS
jgi:fructose-bisphosphate aldolase class 1